MTLEAWVNPATATAAWRDVIYKGNDNYYLEGDVDRPGVPAAWAARSAAGVTARRRWPVNTWSYLAVTLRRGDAAAVRQRHPGREPGATGAIATSTNPLHDRRRQLYGQYFQGLIDEVRVYNAGADGRPDPDRHEHAGRRSGHAAADGAASLTATAVSGSADQSELDGVDGQRRR